MAACQYDPWMLLIAGLAFYFILMDIRLFFHLLEPFEGSDISVKGVMQAPNIVYMELPLAEFMERTLKLSSLTTANQMSLLGVAFGLLAAYLISSGERGKIVAGVLAYKLRDMADSLDGVVARGAGVRLLPHPGSMGYYMDGWCDVASNVFLLIAVGIMLSRKDSYMHLGGVTKEESFWSWLHTFWPWVSVSLLGIQAVIASTGWNFTIQHLSILLESPGMERLDELRHPVCIVIIYMWRLFNPLMLSQPLLVALLMGKTKVWVIFSRGFLFFPILATGLISWLFVTHLSANMQ